MDLDTQLIFVYGTLKNGHKRHDLLAGGKFLDHGTLPSGFVLVDCGGYPGLIEASSADSHPVSGEIYAVESAHLSVLDEYEAVDSGEYKRVPISVLTRSGNVINAQTYLFLRHSQAIPVIGGTWELEREKHFRREFPEI